MTCVVCEQPLLVVERQVVVAEPVRIGAANFNFQAVAHGDCANRFEEGRQRVYRVVARSATGYPLQYECSLRNERAYCNRVRKIKGLDPIPLDRAALG